MRIDCIKPIPKYIEKQIKDTDKRLYPTQDGHVRYYSYLTKNDGELVKVTVAVKCRYKKWYVKQVAIHGLNSEKCFAKDMCFTNIAGYNVGWFAEGLTKYQKWFEDSEWGFALDKYFDPYATIMNKEYLEKFENFKYACWDMYNGTDILQYLRLYDRYPQVEYMMKIGLNNYVKSVQLLKKVGRDKAFRKWLCKNKETLSSRHFNINAILQSYKTKNDLLKVQRLITSKRDLRNEYYREIRETFVGDYEKFFDYLNIQNTSLSSYSDYLKACKYLNLDMSNFKNRYPKDFKRWHDIRIDEYHTKKALEDKEKQAALYRQFESVATKYLNLQKTKGNYAILIAKNPTDLITEGETLHHCVGRMNYDQKFIREETLIFFVRNTTNLETPLVTLEYSLQTKKVLQCYGDNDSKPPKEILSFVNTKWLPYANKQLKKLQAA